MAETCAKHHPVCSVPELPPGQRRIIDIKGRSIGIFNIDGAYYALRNHCPHQGAELCKGRLLGTMLPSPPGVYHYGRQGEILRCPWHGWEFDITTGRSIGNPEKCRVKTFDVTVEAPPQEDVPTVETFPVSVESGWVVVHV